MKTKSNASSQLLILAMAALVIVFMIQVARAQDISNLSNYNSTVAQSGTNQSQIGSGFSSSGQAEVLQIEMPQKSLARRIRENTTLGYYQQFLGPTMAGSSNETYNVFQEGLNTPRSGRAPLQSFHAARLAYQINPKWAVGASLAAVNGYTNEVETRGGGLNRPATEFFNARAFVVMPSLNTNIGTLFTTVSYEAPTSSISRNDDMKYGVVLTNSFTFKSSNPRWTYGILGQYYRSYFRHDRNVKPPPFPGGQPTPLQAVIVSGGPFATYRFNDNWQMGSLITLDWDQRGGQAGSNEFNNNLPHRGRLSLNYFPSSIKYLTNVGVFTQALLKYRAETTALGAEFAVKF